MSDLPFHGISFAERAEIEALIAEGSWRVDHGFAKTLWELNSQEVVLRGLKPGADISGRGGIRAWGERRDAATHITRHVVTNVRIFRNEAGEMKATSILTMYRREGEGLGSPKPFMVADFEDTFCLEEGRWLLSERKISPMFMDVDEH